MRITTAVLAAVFALSGCGAVASVVHKVEATARQKGLKEAQSLVNEVSKKVTAIKLRCHASPAHIESIDREIARKYGVHLPSATAIARAICR